MSNELAVREESRALTPAQQRTEHIRQALVQRLPSILPNGMSEERFAAVTVQAIAKNPDLLNADPATVIMASLEAAQLGLEPTGSLSRAWMVTYGEKAQLMIGYQGLIDLARRSGEVKKVVARVVYDGDVFAVEYGTNESITHTPALATSDPSAITHVYAIAWLANGDTSFDVMTKEQVDAIRARSRSANKGPWVTDYAEMAKKTVVRRLMKALPLTAEVMDAVQRDDERWFGQVEASVDANSRAAAVRALVASKTQPAQDAPGAVAEVEVVPDATVVAAAVQQAETDGQAREICGAASDPALGEQVYCVLDPGHKLAHTSDDGTKFPAHK